MRELYYIPLLPWLEEFELISATAQPFKPFDPDMPTEWLKYSGLRATMYRLSTWADRHVRYRLLKYALT